ncbi:MAG: hypothetical protein K9G46_14670 [Flavobacteriales bacterium]|jgi:hypothetical protein|nr:hypothetical protein [Flavobacteriales bacterium]
MKDFWSTNFGLVIRWVLFLPIVIGIYLLLLFLAWYPYDWFGTFGLYAFCSVIGIGGVLAGSVTPD